jgi:hypothetical protein
MDERERGSERKNDKLVICIYHKTEDIDYE